MAPLKHPVFLLLFLILSVSNADGAGVKLERLEDFDSGVHKIAVNTHVEVIDGCFIDPGNIHNAYGVLLTRFGLQTAALNDSHLEFAVSIKGMKASVAEPCGVMILSMVRQIPNIKMLRLSPDSNSKRYRLWTAENVVTSTHGEIESLLEDQARKDVVEFYRVFDRINQ